jgi:hypothetical protein
MRLPNIYDKINVEFRDYKFLILFIVIIIPIAIDSYFGNVMDAFSIPLKSIYGILLFSIVILSSIIIINVVFNVPSLNLTKVHHMYKGMSQIIRITRIIQTILIFLIFFILIQIYLMSGFFTYIFHLVNILSYGFAVCLSIYLASKLLSWFKFKKSLITLVYGIASILIVINISSTLMIFEYALIEKPIIFSYTSPIVYEFEAEKFTLKWLMFEIQKYSLQGLFIAMWIGSIFLLYSRINQLGKIKFWILISLPLIVFSSIFLGTYDLIYDITESGYGSSSETLVDENVPYILSLLVLAISTMVCGLLFGIGFRFIGKLVDKSKLIQNYLYLTSFGIILFFITSFTSIGSVGYPPFGLVSVTLVPFSLFLILNGLYFSSVAIAHDNNIRYIIKKSIKEYQFIENIGEAEMHKIIETKVNTLINNNIKNMTLESGISPSLSDEEIKKQINNILKELNK